MTNEEAIEIIKYASAFNNENSKLTKALEIAIKALEKQIPKKTENLENVPPITQKRFGFAKCPTCKRKTNNFHPSQYSYCEWCGQRLDWGGMKNE